MKSIIKKYYVLLVCLILSFFSPIAITSVSAFTGTYSGTQTTDFSAACEAVGIADTTGPYSTYLASSGSSLNGTSIDNFGNSYGITGTISGSTSTGTFFSAITGGSISGTSTRTLNGDGSISIDWTGTISSVPGCAFTSDIEVSPIVQSGFAGSFIGTVTDTYTGCTDPAENGVFIDGFSLVSTVTGATTTGTATRDSSTFIIDGTISGSTATGNGLVNGAVAATYTTTLNADGTLSVSIVDLVPPPAGCSVVTTAELAPAFADDFKGVFVGSQSVDFNAACEAVGIVDTTSGYSSTNAVNTPTIFGTAIDVFGNSYGISDTISGSNSTGTFRNDNETITGTSTTILNVDGSLSINWTGTISTVPGCGFTSTTSLVNIAPVPSDITGTFAGTQTTDFNAACEAVGITDSTGPYSTYLASSGTSLNGTSIDNFGNSYGISGTISGNTSTGNFTSAITGGRISGSSSSILNGDGSLSIDWTGTINTVPGCAFTSDIEVAPVIQNGFAGSFIGTVTETVTGCTDPSENGVFIDGFSVVNTVTGASTAGTISSDSSTLTTLGAISGNTETGSAFVGGVTAATYTSTLNGDGSLSISIINSGAPAAGCSVVVNAELVPASADDFKGVFVGSQSTDFNAACEAVGLADGTGGYSSVNAVNGSSVFGSTIDAFGFSYGISDITSGSSTIGTFRNEDETITGNSTTTLNGDGSLLINWTGAISTIPSCTFSSMASVSNIAPVIVDGDADGVPDLSDNCPAIANSSQTNTDGDSQGDACDADDDNDGVDDGSDNSPLNPDLCEDVDGDTADDCSVGTDDFGPLADNDPSNDGLDTDSDGIANVGDTDDDNDGMTDVYESANGLNPLSAIGDDGAAGDKDNDGFSNIDEFTASSGANDNTSFPATATGFSGTFVGTQTTDFNAACEAVGIMDTTGPYSTYLADAGSSLNGTSIDNFGNSYGISGSISGSTSTSTFSSPISNGTISGTSTGTLNGDGSLSIDWTGTISTVPGCSFTSDIEVAPVVQSGLAGNFIGSVTNTFTGCTDTNNNGVFTSGFSFINSVTGSSASGTGNNAGTSFTTVGTVSGNTETGTAFINGMATGTYTTTLNADGTTSSSLVSLTAPPAGCSVTTTLTLAPAGADDFQGIFVGTQSVDFNAVCEGVGITDSTGGFSTVNAVSGTSFNGVSVDLFGNSFGAVGTISGSSATGVFSTEDGVISGTTSSSLNSDGTSSVSLTGSINSIPGCTFTSTSSLVNIASNSNTSDDFNKDSKSDILWRNSSGLTVLWQMDGGTISSSSIVSTISPSVWTVEGTGDFTGDGKADVLWRNTSGLTVLWQMDGGTISSASVVSTISPSAWTVEGTGDFDGDGKTDILWRSSAGLTVLWQMDGGTISGSSVVTTIPSSWTVEGTGDFDGDGKADILWRNTSGLTVLWQMDGGTISSSSIVSTISPSVWTVEGTGDFNGDGKTDVLWRNTSGLTVLWQMDGGTISSASVVSTISPSVWTVEGTGDFDGDGKTDIFWRNTSGVTVLWQMDGGTISGSSVVTTIPSSWTVENL